MSNPADVAVAWAMTLVEPLIAPARREKAETEFLALAHSHPRWTATFSAGVLADVAGTFPFHDPWRHLSARIGPLTVGPHPPPTMGARRPLGERFGSWGADGDLVAAGRPELDPELVAVADELDPAAAALVAFAPLHWSEVMAAIGELWRALVQAPFPHCSDTPAVEDWQSALCQAMRRVVYRRRAYWGGVDDDTVPVDACRRWSMFASVVVAGDRLDHRVVAGTIDHEREVLTRLHHSLNVLPGGAS
jgi:hypothetical protein